MRTPHLLAGACTAGDPEGPYRHAQLAIWDELTRSVAQHPCTWLSAEEGATILGVEVTELWEEVRANRIGRARAEAAQLGAMAVRFIADLYPAAGAVAEQYRGALGEQNALRAEVGPIGRPLASVHEAFGFLKREYYALWTAIVMGYEVRPAAVRVAAMAVRFVAEITTEATLVDRTIQ